MKKLILLIVLVQSISLSAQVNSRNGYRFATKGTIRALLVFAEALNDTLDKGALGSWQPGQMPPNAGSYFDHVFTSPNSVSNYVTRYFYEASHDSLIILGDYIDTLIQVEFTDITSHGIYQVIDSLNKLPGNDIITHSGYSIYSGDFDMWTPSISDGDIKINNSDAYIDMLIVVWRTNSKLSKDRNGGRTEINTNTTRSIKSKQGVNAWVSMCTDGIAGLMRHELAHSFLGGNQFHSGGAGGGPGTYLSDMGGYSLLGSWNKNLDFVNAWDKWRLGWKLATNYYFISARDTGYAEVDSDLVYGQQLNSDEFILRDFAIYGDAIRIKLPYLKSINASTKEQYLWVENRQLNEDKIEYKSNVPKGIRLNIQVGNDDLSSFANSSTNYISPLSFFGNYDFTYSLDGEYYQASTSDQLANPFTGYHLLQQHAINYLEPNIRIIKDSQGNIIHTYYYNDKILDNEYILPKDVFFNDSQIFSYYPIFGNQYDVFPVGSKISISTNPTPSSVLTYRTTYRYSYTSPYSTPRSDDNRYIFLNGISIEVLEQKQNGDIRIRILWDDFDVNDDVRWCGHIVLKENINLKASKIIELDQGLTPVKPVNHITFNGEKIFADPTVFVAKDSSCFNLEINSKLNVKNNSVLILEPGSLLELTDGACLTVYEGSTLKLQNGATLHISGTGRVEIKDGGYICIETGADIILQDALSVINLRLGSIAGVNTSVIPDPGTCMSNPENASYTGNGSINQFIADTYVQNETFTTDQYITGSNIYAGSEVTGSPPYGDVVVDNGAHVIFDAEQNIILESGFEVKAGGELTAGIIN